MVRLPGEVVAPLYLRQVRRRKRPHGGDEEPRRDRVSGVGADVPYVRGVVEGRFDHPRGELDVAAEVVSVGDVFEVVPDLLLRRIPLRPLPFLPKLLVERERVYIAVRVAPRPRIPVPIPRSSDALPGFENPRRKPEVIPQAVEHIKSREPRPDDHRVKVGLRLPASLPDTFLNFRHASLLLVSVRKQSAFASCFASSGRRIRMIFLVFATEASTFPRFIRIVCRTFPSHVKPQWHHLEQRSQRVPIRLSMIRFAGFSRPLGTPQNIFPGFKVPFGSAIFFSFRMKGIESPCSASRCSIFPKPTPCSPVHVPPRSSA